MGRIYCVSASPSARRSGAARPSRDQSIQNEQHDRSHDGHRKSHRIAFAIPTGRTTDETAEQRTRNAEKNGDDEAARVAPGGEELGDDAGEARSVPATGVVASVRGEENHGAGGPPVLARSALLALARVARGAPPARPRHARDRLVRRTSLRLADPVRDHRVSRSGRSSRAGDPLPRDESEDLRSRRRPRAGYLFLLAGGVVAA